MLITKITIITVQTIAEALMDKVMRLEEDIVEYLRKIKNSI